MYLNMAALVFVMLVSGALANRNILQLSSSSGGFSSSVQCSAKADATAISQAKNAYVQAISNAVAAGCSADFGGRLEDIESKFSGDWAAAFAAAVTNAQSQCVSTGNAFGCSQATATAKAYAQATAQAHAEAVSAAINQCTCTQSSTISFGAADTYIGLVAQACSAVGSAVCVQGDQSASASSYQTCLGVAATRVFAKAVADALIQGGCMNTSAQTSIRAETGGDFQITQGCVNTQTSSGPPGSSSTSSSGSGTANAFPGFPPLPGR